MGGHETGKAGSEHGGDPKRLAHQEHNSFCSQRISVSLRSKALQHDFEHEYSHVAWGSDLGLSETSVAATPMYTLLDRRAVNKTTGAWNWDIEDGFKMASNQIGWMRMRLGTFSRLFNGVFHALWEAYHESTHRPRPIGEPSKSDRDAIARAQALSENPVGTEVRRDFSDASGNVSGMNGGVVSDFYEPYWRVRYPDGGWEDIFGRKGSTPGKGEGYYSCVIIYRMRRRQEEKTGM